MDSETKSVSVWLATFVMTALPLAVHSHGNHALPGPAPAAARMAADEAAAEPLLRALVKAYPALAARVLAEHHRAHAEGAEADPAAASRQLTSKAESAAGGFAFGASQNAAKVVVVDFFDYHCGPCKRATHELFALADRERDVRFVFKEMPVLSPESRAAARAALAARGQGRYREFHLALMSTSGVLTESRVIAIAGKVGLDTARLRQDMKSLSLEQELDSTIELAGSLGIKATPSFLVNGEVLAGRDPKRLEQLIEDARAKSPQPSREGLR